MSGHVDPITRALGGIALASVVVITVICLTVEFLRTDLSWTQDPLSLYVIGPYGSFVQASFFAPAPGMVALGLGWHRALSRHARSVIPLVLFMIAALALCFTAAFVTDTSPWPVDLHGRIHMWAAFATFVCVTAAMLLQSLRLRLDPRWRAHFIEGTTIASITIVYFWVYALTPIPRGLGEKAVIGLVMLWLWRAGWWLACGRTG